MSAATKNESAPKPIASKAAWAKLALHTIQLPSGAWVKIRIPDLTVLLLGNAVPERLRGAAIAQVFEDIAKHVTPPAEGEAGPDDEARMESLRDLNEVQRWLVLQMVQEPSLADGDLDDVPADDLGMLTLIAIRERNTDARGVTIGVDPLSRWDAFREVAGRLEGGEAAIEELRQRFSTSLLDRV